MGTNVFFDNFSHPGEQELIEDLIIEAIEIYGMDLYYIPRVMTSYDELYTEDDGSQYNSFYMIPMYIKNVEGFQGDGDFLSKFGVEIRDRTTFTVARRTFSEQVGSSAVLVRPREGDLIYFPLNNKIFIIKFVEHESVFYQMGALQTWDLICELFEYSNEKFSTGLPYVDLLDDGLVFDNTDSGILFENGDVLVDEQTGDAIGVEDDTFKTNILDDNDMFETQAHTFIDFSETNPFGSQ